MAPGTTGYERVIEELRTNLDKLVSTRKSQQRTAEKIRKLELNVANLRKTLELLNVPQDEIPAEAPGERSSAASLPLSRFGKTRVIDAIKDVVAPGETVTVSHIVGALQGRDVHLHQSNPG